MNILIKIILGWPKNSLSLLLNRIKNFTQKDCFSLYCDNCYVGLHEKVIAKIEIIHY